jgi:cellulose synthase operon protein C
LSAQIRPSSSPAAVPALSRQAAPRRRRSTWIAALAFAAAGVLVGPRFPAAPARIDVEWTGCAASLRGPLCEIDGDAALTLWLPDRRADGAGGCPDLDVRVDGRPVPAEAQAVQAGRRLRVPVGQADRQLAVHCGHAEPAFSLALAPRDIPAELDEIDRLRRTSPAEALRRARAASARLPSGLAGVADWIEARILAPTDGIDAARPVFARAIDRLERAGRLSTACDARLALAYFLREDLRLAEAHAVLDAGAACTGESPTHRALWPYFHAITALEEPDIRAAAALLQRAILAQERLGMAEDLAMSRQQQARVLALLGRFEESIALLRAALPPEPSCERALVLNELGWTALQAGQAGRPLLAIGEIRAALEEGLAAARGCGPSWRLDGLLQLNLAFAEVAAGRADQAAAALAAARAGWQGDDALARPWWLELEGHVARLRGRSDAAESAFRSLESLGAVRLDDHARWRAALGLGQTFEESGAPERAVLAYRSAEASIDRELRLVPFGEGRASFVDARSPGTGRLIALLVRLGRDGEAAAVARHSLRRGLNNLLRASRLSALDRPAHARWRELVSDYRRKRRALERQQLASWRLPDAELVDLRRRALALEEELRRALDSNLRDDESPIAARAPAAGEVLLVYHPLDGGDWIGFALDERGALARRLGAIDPAAPPERAAAQVLDPFADAIRQARVVRVLAPGALAAIDFHALPFEGGPLLAARSVLHTLDVGGEARGPAAGGPLVAGDQSGGLPAAQREAKAVAAALGRATLLGAGADMAELAGALERSDHFHYAGHGSAAGPDGLESSLVFGDELHLSSADILTLSRVPSTVVLSGCDLARTAPSATSSLGVGQAFVVRGAGAVVAPVRPVRDEDAAEFSRLFYAALPSAPSLAGAVASAQLTLRARGGDWSAFRILVP